MVVKAFVLVTQKGGGHVAAANIQAAQRSVELNQLAVYEQGGIAIILVFGQVHLNHVGRCGDHGAGMQRVRRDGHGHQTREARRHQRSAC